VRFENYKNPKIDIRHRPPFSEGRLQQPGRSNDVRGLRTGYFYPKPVHQHVNTFRSPRGSPAPQMDSPDQAEASLSDQERSGTNIDHPDREGNYFRHSGSEIDVLEYSDNSRSNNRNPDLNRHYPDLPRDHPDLNRHYPDHPRDHPDLNRHYPDLPRDHPDLNRHYPDHPRDHPDFPDTSERGHMSPGAHPDHPRANPDHPRDHPDLPRHNPDLPKVHPDHPRDHPDLPDTAERSHRSPIYKIDLQGCSNSSDNISREDQTSPRIHM